jgi:outer membrane protein assembly factor BamA
MKGILIAFFSLVCFSVCAQQLYLELKGKNTKEDSLLIDYKSEKTFSDFKNLKSYTDALIIKLQTEGFLNLRNDTIIKRNDSVLELNLHLNKKYSHLYLINYKAFEDKIPLKDSILNIAQVEATMYDILNKLSKEGKPFSQVRLKEVNVSDSDTISASLSLEVSDKRIINDIVIRGYKNMPYAFVKNFGGIKIGDVYNREKLIEQSDRLSELPFLEQTKSPQVLFTPDSTNLYLYYEKSKANSFDGFLGFNNSDNNSFQLIGNIDLILTNNFNYGEELRLNYKNDGNQQEKFDLNLRLPYLFGSKFSVEGSLNFFRQDTTFSNSSQSLKVDYQISRNLSIGGLYQFENSSNLLNEDTQRTDIADFEKNKFALNFNFFDPKRLNALFLPSRFLNLNVGIANRENDMSAQDQEFVNVEGRYIFKVFKRQFVYTAVEGGFLLSDDYLSNELYRFGGVNSIRGFAENRFFANTYGTLQTEYRYILGSNLYINSVLDFGFYENEVNNFNENLYSIGIGVGIQTKAGLIKFIAANGGASSQQLELQNTQIHLKFLTFF